VFANMLQRRELLGAGLMSGLVCGAAARAEDVAGFRRAAFGVKTLQELLSALKLAAPQPSADVKLQGPELSEDGAVVPLSLGCSAPGVLQMLLCIERNPTLLAAIFEPGPAVEPQFSTRVKMQQSSNVTLLAVLNDGRVLSASREVRVTLGGCIGAADAVPERGGQPTLIRVQPGPGLAIVRALMKHEMESGQRKDDGGRAVPAWHIQQVVARVNGTPVLTAQWGTSISKNPFLQFGVKGAKPGDRIALAWADNRGATRSDEVTVS
jgi:sulfur-oxidizing protein SoxY